MAVNGNYRLRFYSETPVEGYTYWNIPLLDNPNDLQCPVLAIEQRDGTTKYLPYSFRPGPTGILAPLRWIMTNGQTAAAFVPRPVISFSGFASGAAVTDPNASSTCRFYLSRVSITCPICVPVTVSLYITGAIWDDYRQIFSYSLPAGSTGADAGSGALTWGDAWITTWENYVRARITCSFPMGDFTYNFYVSIHQSRGGSISGSATMNTDSH